MRQLSILEGIRKMSTIETLKKSPPLDARLALAASFVRQGSVVCDVGTDHAYLPIWLLTHGIVDRAVACDINEGPLQSARSHAAQYACADRITFCLSDGLRGIDLSGERVGDIVLCGMGGELIARIYSECPYTKRPDVRGILQPMSSAEDLRFALGQAGYRIEDEKLAFAAGRIYTCMAVSYDGVLRAFSPAELVLGEAHIRRGRAGGELFIEYLRRNVRSAEKKYRGRKEGALDASAEEALLRELYTIAEKENIQL